MEGNGMIMERKQMTYVLVGYLRVDIDLVRVIEINEDLFGEKVATFEWDGMVRQSRIYTKDSE
jgi:hypothetical protein